MAGREQPPEQSPVAAAAPPGPAEPRYEPVAPHWFYRKAAEPRERWVPFSAQDSARLEEAHGAGRVGGVLAGVPDTTGLPGGAAASWGDFGGSRGVGVRSDPRGGGSTPTDPAANAAGHWVQRVC